MRRHQRCISRGLSLALIVGIASGCGGSDASPSAVNADHWLTATVDGQPFRATEVVAFVVNSGGRETLSLTGVESCTNGWSLSFYAQRVPVGQPFGLGTYSVSVSQEVAIGTGVRETHRELSASVSVVSSGSYSYWDAPGVFGTGGSGTLQITNLTSMHVEGTFSFQGMARSGNTQSGSTKSVTNGAFRALLRDTRIC
jgi:hypothetical protein